MNLKIPKVDLREVTESEWQSPDRSPGAALGTGRLFLPQPVGVDTKHGIRVTAAYSEISPLSVFNRSTAHVPIIRTRTSQETEGRKMRRIQGSSTLGTIFFFLFKFQVNIKLLISPLQLSNYQTQLICVIFLKPAC